MSVLCDVCAQLSVCFRHLAAHFTFIPIFGSTCIPMGPLKKEARLPAQEAEQELWNRASLEPSVANDV
jgi:hypothetical protein